MISLRARQMFTVSKPMKSLPSSRNRTLAAPQHPLCLFPVTSPHNYRLDFNLHQLCLFLNLVYVEPFNPLGCLGSLSVLPCAAFDCSVSLLRTPQYINPFHCCFQSLATITGWLRAALYMPSVLISTCFSWVYTEG